MPIPSDSFTVVVHHRAAVAGRLPALTDYVTRSGSVVPLSRHPAWLNVLHAALGHEPYAVEALGTHGRTVGFLPLAFLDTLLFGKFLVSLPYLNSNGVLADSAEVANGLVTRAVALADEFNARHLELRHEAELPHDALTQSLTTKVHMRLPLPADEEKLWKGFEPKVRNQVRKGEKPGFIIQWGGVELLPAFHDVLSRNMRDLGSPVYGPDLFREVLVTFPTDAELCVVFDGPRPVASALLLHGRGVTEVPTASSLKEYNPTSVNMLMYWHLLRRAVARRQRVFDFGRSTTDGNTYRFKKQWGAVPHPAVWQYYLRRGTVGELRPDNPRFRLAIRLWKKLPLAVTRWLGPLVVRGIP